MNLNILISYILAEIFMIIGLNYSLKKISNKNIILNAKFYIITILFVILLVLNNWYTYVNFRFFTATILVITYSKLVLNNKWRESIIFGSIFCIAAAFIEILASPILTLFVNDPVTYNSNIVLKTSFSLVSTILLMTIFSFRRTNMLVHKIEILLKDDTNRLCTFLILVILLNVIIFVRFIEFGNIYLITASATCITIMICSLIITITDKYNIKIIKDKNLNLKNSFKAYKETIEECKEFKHNLKNDLIALKTTLSPNEKEIVNDIITKYNKNYEWINDINSIPEGLQGIIYLKTKEAEKKKIQVMINTKGENYNTSTDFLNISNIVGIILDNAIEATKNAKSKVIVINIEESKNHFKIEIINKFTNNIDLNLIGNKNYSTKEYKSGIGLNYIKKIKKNKIKVDFKIVSNLFISTIIL